GQLPDIVATQGKFLVPPISTPTFASRYNANFAAALVHALRRLQEKGAVRRVIYGEQADTWPQGHTPPSVRAQFQSDKHMALRELMTVLTPPTP
ncbi:hypothetical protein BU26DRAFT_379676, partial [Trematosphaeria pertusa]